MVPIRILLEVEKRTQKQRQLQLETYMIQLLTPCASVDIQARTLVPLRLYWSRWCSSARRWQRVGRSSVCGGICECCVDICGVNHGYCRGKIHSSCGQKVAALLLVVVVSGCRPLWLVVALVATGAAARDGCGPTLGGHAHLCRMGR